MSSSRRSALVAVACCAALAAGCRAPAAEDGPADDGLSVADLLGGEAAPGFERAVAVRPFLFPRDHGPHTGFRTEWWYFVGNLRAADGSRYGYQLTLFRNALAPQTEAAELADGARADGSAEPVATVADPGASRWRDRHVWMGHMAVTDVAGERFRAFERFSREGLGLAGATAEPFAVWLEDWRIEGSLDGASRLTAHAGGWGIELGLEATQPVVLQGERGLSVKGDEPGNASYYYSIPALATSGRLLVDGEPVAVTGVSWLDREWSTSALEEGIEGWDWFALQLDDGRELMLYRLRTDGDGTHPLSAGTLVDAAGVGRSLTAADFRVEVLDRWRSSESDALYPAAWRIELPSEPLVLEVRSLLADQEHRHSVVYWEGAVAVEGSGAVAPVTGVGYAELTGYSDPGRGRSGS